MTRSLLLFNLATDADDPVLGFTTLWINRLAKHYDQIDVITMRAGRLAVAENVAVYSVGKERGYSEPRRALAFYRLLSGLLVRRSYVACFAHMMPIFAAMGAPLLKLRGIRLVMWYTHRQISRSLQAGAALSDRVVTAAPDSFPIPTPKLRVLGHGVDTDFFSPLAETFASTPPQVIQVARLMPIKHQETLLRASAQLSDCRVMLVGGAPPETDGLYEQRLRALVGEMGMSEWVIFAGSQPLTATRDFYRQSHLAVNLSPPGLFDKAALESMAVGLPTIVANPAFDPLLGSNTDLLRIESPEDIDGLKDRLERLLAMTPAERRAIGDALRQRVVESHSLNGLVERLMRVLETGE